MTNTHNGWKSVSLIDAYGTRKTYRLSFPTNLQDLRDMGAAARGQLVAQLFAAYRARVIEAFVYAHMPPEFQKEYERRSVAYHPREAFKRTLSSLCRSKERAPEADLTGIVIEYMRKTGSFSPSDLDAALGREATDKERRQIDKFLNSLSDEQLQALIGDADTTP